MLTFDPSPTPLGPTAVGAPPTGGEWALLLLVAALLLRLAVVLHRQQRSADDGTEPKREATTSSQATKDTTEIDSSEDAQTLAVLDRLGLYALRIDPKGRIQRAGAGLQRLVPQEGG